jgi:hypothetical protein
VARLVLTPLAIAAHGLSPAAFISKPKRLRLMSTQ